MSDTNQPAAQAASEEQQSAGTGIEASAIAVPAGETGLLSANLDPATRFAAVDVDGLAVKPGSDRHAYTRDTWLGIDWLLSDVSEDELTYAAAEEAIARLRETGDAGLRLPTRAELLSIVDDTRYRPAVDPALFPAIRSDWYWSSTPVAWSPASVVWVVSFGSGGSNVCHRDLRAFVRAVRASRQ
jgi:hypothetical protein